MNKMTTVAIIGTAGRDGGKKLTKTSFQKMTDIATTMINKFRLDENSPIVLVSGGAAWADHIAVELFERGLAEKLRLHIPCPFELDKKAFSDDGSIDWQKNPGRTTNHYHRLFSKIIEKNSLNQMSDVIDLGAEVVVGQGFHDRNSRVAKDSSHLIAFTFGSGETVKEGGTADTTKKYLKKIKQFFLVDQSYHVDLNTYKVYKGAKVA